MTIVRCTYFKNDINTTIFFETHILILIINNNIGITLKL